MTQRLNSVNPRLLMASTFWRRRKMTGKKTETALKKQAADRKKRTLAANIRPAMPENLVSIAEAAEMTGYSRQTIYTWLFKKKVTKYKSGHFVAVDRNEIRNFATEKKYWKEIGK